MSLKCPCCRRRLKKMPWNTRDPKSHLLQPWEVKFRCIRCDSTFLFSGWSDYLAACDYEYQKTRNWIKRINFHFNPSFKRRKMKI